MPLLDRLHKRIPNCGRIIHERFAVEGLDRNRHLNSRRLTPAIVVRDLPLRLRLQKIIVGRAGQVSKRSRIVGQEPGRLLIGGDLRFKPEILYLAAEVRR